MMQAHEVAQIFPMMSVSEFENLKADIAANGLREPVWTYRGQIIDGRNRYKACSELGIAPACREWDGKGELVAFVVSLNLHRRHLTESQRAMVAAKVASLPAGGIRQGQNTTASQTANLQFEGVTRAAAAEMLNVSERSVNTAKKIERDAEPEIVEAVTSGELSLNLAAQVSALPAEEQKEVAAAEDVKEAAVEAVKRAHVANNSGNNEWYTPAKYIDLARQVMGEIDTDPATSEIANKTVKAATIFTAEDDGRKQEWSGRVWMNPPYAQPLISDFSEAISAKFGSGEISEACVLVNNATETQWFQRMMEKAAAVCFPRGRVRFVDQDGNQGGAPLQGQAILYFGDNAECFASVFGSEGFVAKV